VSRVDARGPGVSGGIPVAADAGCAYCLWNFSDSPGEPITRCEFCKTPFHIECYEENGGCVTFGCPAWTADQLGEPLPVAAPPPAMTQLQFCTYCGVQVSPADRFCEQCGSALT
jgi:Prokaryotic RING finger family 1/zinc-ribbon domain